MSRGNWKLIGSMFNFPAAFKIIKGLLPPKAVEALKFINKKNISDYITPENQLTCWGGKDDYKFVFTPQDPKVQILPRDPEDMGDGNNNESQITNRNQNGSIKKVSYNKWELQI